MKARVVSGGTVRVFDIVATDGRLVVSRLLAVLIQRDVELVNLHVTRFDSQTQWRLQLTARFVSEAEAELVRKRITRLVDVVKVLEFGP